MTQPAPVTMQDVERLLAPLRSWPMTKLAQYAAAGHCEHQVELALRYATGMRGAPQDEVKARQLWRTAAAASRQPAALLARHCLAIPEASLPDASTMAALGQLLRDGFAPAATLLGILHMRSLAFETAYQQFAQGAAHGTADAQFFQGLCLEAGLGCSKDQAAGKPLIRKASDEGMKLAQIVVGYWPQGAASTAERIRAAMLRCNAEHNATDDGCCCLYPVFGVPFFQRRCSSIVYCAMQIAFKAGMDLNCGDATFLALLNREVTSAPELQRAEKATLLAVPTDKRRAKFTLTLTLAELRKADTSHPGVAVTLYDSPSEVTKPADLREIWPALTNHVQSAATHCKLPDALLAGFELAQSFEAQYAKTSVEMGDYRIPHQNSDAELAPYLPAALKNLQRLADEGYAVAQLALAHLHFARYDAILANAPPVFIMSAVLPDSVDHVRRGQRYLQAAVRQRLARAVGTLGVCYCQNVCGYDRNYDKAYLLLTEARACLAYFEPQMAHALAVACLYSPHHRDYAAGVRLLRDNADHERYEHSQYLLWLFMSKGSKGLLRNEQEALRQLRAAADNGYGPACSAYGVLLQEGNYPGVRADAAASIKYLLQAAERSDLEALYRLGRAYESGSGTLSVDHAKAVDCYRKAATGKPQALLALAACYERGQGVAKNPARAFQLYLDKAHAWSEVYCELGRCYEKGIGVAPDRDAARSWYRKAVKSGVPAGMYALGMMLLEEGEEQKGRELIEKASAKAHLEGSLLLAELEEKELRSGSVTRKKKGKKVEAVERRYEAAMAAGISAARWKLARFLLRLGESGAATRNTRAFELLKGDKGEDGIVGPNTRLWLGLCYEFGLGVGKDLSKAAKLYKQLAEEDRFPAGLYHYGRCLADGRGVALNAAQGKSLRETARKLNYDDAAANAEWEGVKRE